MSNDNLTHYGVPGMRWGRHMARERAAFRANRAHHEVEQVKKAVDKVADPYNRKVKDRENAAKRTGKARDIERAQRARDEAKIFLARGERVLNLYKRKENRRDAAVRKADKAVKELGELKLKSTEFDHWLERQ